MTFSANKTVRKWTLGVAGLLFATALTLFGTFAVLTYREEAEAFRLGETYDSITSSYLAIMLIAVVVAISALLSLGVYSSAAVAARFQKAIEPRSGPEN